MAADQKCRTTGNITANGVIANIPKPATFVGMDVYPNTIVWITDGAGGPRVTYAVGTTTGGQMTVVDLHGCVYCANGIAVNITASSNVIVRYT